ncbi:MAG: redox-sensing transcriptional repressor Rex [Candidatus Merdivicinus sp.]|jgi:redox-sensing transcriptional repressor
MAKDNVSLSVVRRLPRYHRFLKELLAAGTVRISSGDLSARMGLTASQIRQDLNCFGGFGQQGYGYNVKDLYEEISKILGLDKRRKAILLGAGNLGRAIALHMDFSSRGFELLAIFDANPALVGMDVGGIQVSDSAALEAFCKANHPDVAILCIPKEAARALAETLVKYGIRGFWNFSHYDLTLDYSGIVVENVHLGDSLSTLCFRVNELERNLPKRSS